MNYAISPSRLALLALLAALSVVLLAGASSAQAATCGGLPSYPSSKGGYFLQLTVTKLGCKTGKSLMRSHYGCRVGHGVKGYCTRVRGYRCTERRGNAIATEYSGRVTCKSATRKFVYAYQQNL